MPRWEYPVDVARERELPLYLQIAQAITKDVLRGRLKPGDRLPGTRHLSRALCVSRNTVVAAYEELDSEGWVTAVGARGSFVAASPPEAAPQTVGGPWRGQLPPAVGFDLPPAPDAIAPDAALAEGTLRFGTGTPDVRTLPIDALLHAFRKALRRDGRRTLDYAYDEPRGHPRLRAALASMLAATRGLAATEQTVLVTRGSQMALSLIARELLRPGDSVLVEELGHRPAFEAFARAGAAIVPVRLDAEGIDVSGARRAVGGRRVRAIYLTPHHQHPTTVALSAPRRLELVEWARRDRIAIIEDDYDHEFHYDGPPLLPLAGSDHGGTVIYVGSLSKVLAPGLRIGYLVAPEPLVLRLARQRFSLDIQGDLALEAAVADLLLDGEVLRHARRVRRLYRTRRDLLCEALRDSFGGRLQFDVPSGGLGIWIETADGVDVEAWARRASRAGVTFPTARVFAADGQPRPCARLGFSSLSESELTEAVRRLRRAWPASGSDGET